VVDNLGTLDLQPGTTLVLDSSRRLISRDDDPRYGIAFPATSNRLQPLGITPGGIAPTGTTPGGAAQITSRLASTAGTLDRVDLRLSGAALSSPLICDLRRSTDGGNTWQSLWTSDPSRPTIPPGLTSASLPANPAISFHATDLLILGLSTTSPGVGTVTGTLWIRIPTTP
jgi:hypothetical protein